MFLSFLVPFRSMVRGSSHPSVDILVPVPYSNHGTRMRMSTDESRASNQRSSTRPWRGFSRRVKTRTRSHRGFSRRAKTCTRSHRGFSRRAKTRIPTHTRRVLLSSRSTVLVVCDGKQSERGWACSDASPPSPARADFSMMMECRPKIGHCHSVSLYSLSRNQLSSER